jgi:uncharacterized protein (DUF697 family)
MAEVKVKITAQNEVRTGLQQALQETQKFSQQAKAAVSQSMTINPFAGDDRLGPLRELQQQARALRESARAPIEASAVPQIDAGGEFAQTSARGASAIRGLAADLANATSAGDVFEAVVRRITTAFGGLVAAAAGFAIGSLIRRTLEDAAAGLQGLIDQSQALQQSFSSLSAPTTTFDQLSGAIRGAADQIEALEEANRKLQSGIGFQVADYINAFDLSAAANKETEAGTNNARQGIATAIQAATVRELELAKARTQEERDLIALQAQREQLLAQARRVSPQTEQNLRGLFAAQDSTRSQDRDRSAAEEAQKREASLQAQADKQRAINEDNRRSLEERLQREKQGLADLQQFGGAGVEVLREQTVARIAELEKQIATEKERAAATAEREAEQRAQSLKRDQQSLAALERRAQSPEERRAALETEQAALAQRAASLAPDDFAGRAEVISEAQRIAGELSGFGQAGTTGGVQASALQRVGLASNEFIDTRSKDSTADEVKTANKFIGQIVELLKNSDGLYLSSN